MELLILSQYVVVSYYREYVIIEVLNNLPLILFKFILCNIRQFSEKFSIYLKGTRASIFIIF